MKWPAHLAERAAIFELCGMDQSPVPEPRRAPLEWDGDTFCELDPDNWGVTRVSGVVRVEHEQGSHEDLSTDNSGGAGTDSDRRTSQLDRL